ncbi:nucleotidyltransferase family protein [bacterium]|nr:nucleotidyltransferase family protein [bacterium]
MIAPERVAAVVTAAGFSSRMGSPKALLDWHGKLLLQHQMDALAEIGQVVVVLGHEAERIHSHLRAGANCRVVLNPDYPEGRASSLRRGFEAIAASPEAVLVIGVDQPFAPETLTSLLAQMTAETTIVLPTSAGRRGHPVLFAGALLNELRGITEEGEGLRAVVRRHPVREVPVNDPFWDLNRPEDYARALQA